MAFGVIYFCLQNINFRRTLLNECVELLIIMLDGYEGEKSELSETADVLELPEYCFYNKFLLVEELALERNFPRLHQGRCTVIGKLSHHQDGYLILENIKLPYLPRKYTLPEGSACLRLFKFVTWDVELKIGLYCEVVGEVVLWNPISSRDNWVPLTPPRCIGIFKGLQ
ncbi:uncharacterized protein LOC118751145 [Rhagoletis pomonella]|uniref:uncharacterized protein LOC118751145 n=1 Tax=Rhagoletis pomonella TaxID=28610 RepID=UPI00177CD19C|nr:uncharacterized protein LOC118751145 [Rhagoletis pomonella]